MQGVAGDDERRMTIVQHLEVLRRVLIWVLAAWIVGTAVAFIFNGFFLSLLLHPLHTVLHNSHSIIPGDRAIILNPTEGITVPLKISAVVGLILALPIILWQTWTFVSPGSVPRSGISSAPSLPVRCCCLPVDQCSCTSSCRSASTSWPIS